MQKQDCKVGMKVIFGRQNGEKTLGEVVKMNPKKAKIKTLEDRGNNSKAGEQWGVPYSLIQPATDADLSLYQKHGADAPKVLQGMMQQAAEANDLPDRFKTSSKGSSVVIVDMTTNKMTEVPLFAYGAVRESLADLFG